MAGGRERGEKSETWNERACEHGVDADHATDSECFSHDLFNAPVCTRASVDDERKMPGVPFSAGARMNILTRARASPQPKSNSAPPSKIRTYPHAVLKGAR